MDKPHKKLDVWNLSMDFAGLIYRFTTNLPTDERFGLVSQMRRDAVSIPCNLAEGAARGSRKEFRHFLSIARISLSELDTQLDLCFRLEFLTRDAREELDGPLMRIDKMLYALYELKGREIACEAASKGRTNSIAIP